MHLKKPLCIFNLTCIFLVLCLSSMNTKAQDSLQHYTKVELNSLYFKHLYTTPVKAEIYAQKLLSNATLAQDSLGTITALLKLATIQSDFNNYDKAIVHVDKALELATKNEKYLPVKMNGIFTKGMIDYKFGKLESAFKYYTQAYEYYKKNDKIITTNDISHNIALIREALGDYSGALQILLQNQKTYLTTPENERNSKYHPFFYVNTLLALTDTYTRYANDITERKTSLLDSALIYYRKGLVEARKKADTTGEVYLSINKGIIDYEKDMPHKAIAELDNAEKRIRKFQLTNLLTITHYYKGLSYQKLNDLDKAIAYLQKTDSISEKNSINYQILQGAYYTLAKIYIKRKDSANTFKYQNLYIKNDQINERITGTVRKDIHEKYDIALLNSEIEALTYTTQKQQKSYATAIVIIIILAILFLAFFIYYKKQQRQNKKALEVLVAKMKKSQEAKTVKPTRSIAIDDEKVSKILSELDKFVARKGFLDRNCSLDFVAKKVKTNKTYLSKIIHTHKQQNFIQYITDLRINYAIEKLKDDPTFRLYDVKSIAGELGFKSPDSFSRAFKAKTGIYPSYYIKNIHKFDD